MSDFFGKRAGGGKRGGAALCAGLLLAGLLLAFPRCRWGGDGWAPAGFRLVCDPAHASRELNEEERGELAAQLGKYRAQVVAFYDLGEMATYTWTRTMLAEALERCGLPEAAKTARDMRVLHGPPEFLTALREVETARGVAVYAINFKYKGGPVVIINGGADLRETLLHETFALSYPELNADDVNKRVDDFQRVKAPAAYMAYLRQNPDKSLPGLQAWVYGRQSVRPLSFAQQFYVTPVDWLRKVTGRSSFNWDPNGYLTVATVNNAKGESDEFARQRDIPPLTERDTFTFSGVFELAGSTYGPAKRAGMLFGLGNVVLGKDSTCRGMAVSIEATPEGCTLRAVMGAGTTTQETTGDPVALEPKTLYQVQVSYYPAPGGQYLLEAEVHKWLGDVVGKSTVRGPQQAGFFADRIYLANLPGLAGGGMLATHWYSATVEPEVFPLFRTPLLQARSRVEPNDLVQLCGARLSDNLQVVYGKVADPDHPPTQPPAEALTETTEAHGKFTLASAKGAPESLVVLAPTCMKSGQAYAIWVGKPELTWSPPLVVNNAQPSWISPSFVFAGNDVTVVGRNLQPFPADTGKTLVRLTGPDTYTLTAKNDGKPQTAVEIYAARVTLPADAKQGTYTVEVCRDGTSWTLLEGRTLTVYPQATPKRFDATQYGAKPNDTLDDTNAINQAIAAAQQAGGSEVYLPAGNFIVTSLILPQGVGLGGAGIQATKLSLDYANTKDAKGSGYLITACGYQIIHDLELCDPLGNERGEFPAITSTVGISLGDYVPNKIPADYVTITRCRFTDMLNGVVLWGGGLLPVRHLTITDNVFQAIQLSLKILGVTEGLVRHNTFLPSKGWWNYPSEFAGAYQVELSDNIAEGNDKQYPNGWRNGFFWDLGGSVENNLVSNNRTSYDGDKHVGNGEAFAYDSNQDRLPFIGPCIFSSAEYLTIAANWTEADKYTEKSPIDGAWVRIVDGKGLGQSRRILSHSAGLLNVVRLSAPWDVIPDASSTLAVTHLYWQVYTLDNNIDERKNKHIISGAGVITPYGSSSECVVEGNMQYNTDGIMLLTCHKDGMYDANYFTEIRNNTLIGKMPFKGAYGGIYLTYGTAENQFSHILGYGTIVANNIIDKSDYCNNLGGAVTCTAVWYHPTSLCTWKEALIFGNKISNVPVGVSFDETYSWNHVLYNNQLINVKTPLVDKGKNTVRVTVEKPVPNK